MEAGTHVAKKKSGEPKNGGNRPHDARDHITDMPSREKKRHPSFPAATEKSQRGEFTKPLKVKELPGETKDALSNEQQRARVLFANGRMVQEERKDRGGRRESEIKSY